MSRMFVSATLAAMSLIFAAGCSHDAKKKSAGPTPATAEVTPLAGSRYTTIEFGKGDTHLSESGKAHLREIASRLTEVPRKEVKILAWADQEYPDKVKGRASAKEIILAKERAEVIRSYLEDKLKTKNDIDAFNMAKRPNLMAKLLHNEDFEVKEAYETAGATGVKLDDGSVSYSKASKAIVIIGDQDK